MIGTYDFRIGINDYQEVLIPLSVPLSYLTWNSSLVVPVVVVSLCDPSSLRVLLPTPLTLELFFASEPPASANGASAAGGVAVGAAGASAAGTASAGLSAAVGPASTGLSAAGAASAGLSEAPSRVASSIFVCAASRNVSSALLTA